ncbi:hypothetical protein [Mycoplasma elephantis]|uniref:hypothetical protein n=1 Tax=Mycoplasma elephantis TaxID=114882 RepID=UPI000485E46A|nr:hypothetical protein [Mycoplasma elephantis]
MYNEKDEEIFEADILDVTTDQNINANKSKEINADVKIQVVHNPKNNLLIYFIVSIVLLLIFLALTIYGAATLK